MKIAVLRANALGDFVFTLPAIRALRERYPHAEIILLGKSWHAAFLSERPSDIDRVVVVPQSKGVNGDEHTQDNLAGLQTFFREMQQEKLDIAVQLHGGGKYSNPFMLKLGAKVTVGLKTPDALSLDKWIPYIYYQHEVIRYLEVVSLVDAYTTHITPVIHVTKKDREEALSVIGNSPVPLIILHPGASDPKRRWAPQRFSQVGDILVKKGFRVAVTGSPAESSLVQEVLDDMHESAENLCGKVSLNGLIGLLSLASLVISNDTGPLHAAAAVQAKTIGLYWAVNMINASTLWRAKHRPCISWVIQCPVCKKNLMKTQIDFAEEPACSHNVSLMDGISVEEVLFNADYLLS